MILATAAHELRLPLSHIKGFVTSLLRADVKWDDETRRQFLAEIDLESDRLAELIEILCRPRSSPEDGVPDSSYRRGRTPANSQFIARPLVATGRVTTLPCLRMSGRQIERMLANLIENAIKYFTPPALAGASAPTDH
jgi:signal transduction histidine kinase